ncbi:amidohydrolase [Microbulbifer hainanensis]|uniref:amidohydrolase n=1 Tax=Microbulbifer hainanensis TaxID=2735675 RepID=UPI0018680452|nr:amidohydrolase [Microbulbifer hainanensis]
MRMRILFALLIFPLTAYCNTQLIENIRGAHIVPDKSGKPVVEKFSALAFADGKVLALGDSDEMAGRYPDAEVIDGHGRALIPGLIDAHGHMSALGFLQGEIDLRDKSFAETLSAIKAFAKGKPRGSWITGRGWNQVLWKGKGWPSAADLDALEVSQPIWLRRVDGHAGWANSAALRAAGIDRDTRAPEGGEILRDASGQPTGILVDNAMELMAEAIPAPSQAQVETALGAAFQIALANGLTSVHDAGIDGPTYRAYRALAQRDAIPMRVYPMVMAGTRDFNAMLAQGVVGSPEDRLFIRSIKVVADGALGSRGAAMLADYSDQPHYAGLLLHNHREMDDYFGRALAQGFQINVHAIGDRANRQVLDEFAQFAEQKPAQAEGDFRHRIEHAQIVAPVDIPRFKTLGIVASMQPIHATSDMNMAGDRVGDKRLAGAYAWRTFLDQGTPLAAGSDFPVEPVNPFLGIHAAVTRQNTRDQPPGGWRAQESISLAEALRAFTLGAAYAAHQEHVLGNLLPGKAADFVLLDRDLFAIDPHTLWKTRVLETWVAGEKVYERGQ